MHNLQHNLDKVLDRIHSACDQFQKPAPQLLAVSKKRSARELREAFSLGLRSFGENYLQEALEKQSELTDLNIEWHFIGPIQSNKTRAIAEHFDWVHSVDRLKIAQRLAEQCPEGKVIQICAQINVDQEATKSGLSFEELPEFTEQVLGLKNLRLRGLMAIPAPADNFNAQKASFLKMAEALRQLQLKFPQANLDTLSMGMSSDLEAAIAAGSTIVRVGTDIFGPR